METCKSTTEAVICLDCGKEKETCTACGVSYCVDCEGLHGCEE